MLQDFLQEFKKAQEQAAAANQPKQEEIPPEVEDGIPLPPGFTTHVVNFSKPEGIGKIQEIEELEINYILYGTIRSNLQSIIVAYFMNYIFMVINNIMGWTKAAYGLFNQAFSSRKLNFQQKLILIAEGLGFIALSLYKAYSCGIIGFSPPAPVEVVTVPFFVANE